MKNKYVSLLFIFIVLFASCKPVIQTPQPTIVNTQPAKPSPSPKSEIVPTSIATPIPLPSDPVALDKISWLKDNAVQLSSISPEDDDFSDLQPLKKILEGKRIVMLGEATHGDGNTFLAKTRLIKFLHEEMGFDVLAFESGLFDCQKAWELTESGEDASQAFQEAVLPIWSKSIQVKPLISYLDQMSKTTDPLILAGFDTQDVGDLSRKYLVDDLTTFLSKYPGLLPQDQNWTNWTTQTSTLISYGVLTFTNKGQATESDLELYLNTVKKLQEGIMASTQPNDEEAKFWLQELENLGKEAESRWKIASVGGLNNMYGHIDILNLRDIQMGNNMIWLANEYYPGKKFIVWGHIFHVAHNWGEIGYGYDQNTSMGDIALKAFGNQIYVLGFTSYDGSYGSWVETPQALAPPSENSLEDLMGEAGLNNAIVDFTKLNSGGGWLQEKIVSRPFFYDEFSANWTKILDGIMFIKDMAPSALVSP